MVECDAHFSKYLPDYKYFFSLSIMDYISNFDVVRHHQLMNEYFKKAFDDSTKWPEKSLKYLLESKNFLSFVSSYIPSDLDYWRGLLTKIKMPQSSAHGDFNPGNILVNKNRLYFIDWSNYSFHCSRWFDLIEYYVFCKKAQKSWMEVWQKQKPESLFNIKINDTYWLSYALWKVASEMSFLNLRRTFNEYKINKYAKFISILKQYIQN